MCALIYSLNKLCPGFDLNTKHFVRLGLIIAVGNA